MRQLPIEFATDTDVSARSSNRATMFLLRLPLSSEPLICGNRRLENCGGNQSLAVEKASESTRATDVLVPYSIAIRLQRPVPIVSLLVE